MSCNALKNFLRQNTASLPCARLHARPDAAAGRGDLFIGSAFDALLKIHQPRTDKNRMGVRIDEAREDDFARAVDLENFLAIFLQPGITQSVFGRADGNNLTAEAQDSAIFDDAELLEVGTAARAGLTGS